MTRRLRLKCPVCQAALEVAAAAQPQVDVQCPKCGKRIVAKVAAAPQRASPANSRPIAPPDDLWSSPLGLPDVPLVPQASFPMGANGAYLGAPVRSKVNHKVWLWPTAIALALAIAAPAVWYGGRFLFSLAETDWSTFSLVPDSHERLTSEYLRNAELSFSRSLSADAGNDMTKADVIAYVKRDGRLYEQMLLRAVKLPKGNLTDKTSFQEKFKVIAVNFRDQAIENAKAAEAKAKQENQSPGRSGLLTPQDLQDPVIMDALSVSSTSGVYLLHGIWDLPAPQNEVEQIYYEEADLVREFLKSLGRIGSKRQAGKAHVDIEAQADRVVELAVRRSQLPRDFLERVPPEYVDIDKAFAAAQKVLMRRVERDYELGEDLKDAIANFGTARECIARAASGTSDSVLEKSFADARALRAKTLSRPKTEPADAGERDLVIKPPPTIGSVEEESVAATNSTSKSSSSSSPLLSASPSSSGSAVRPTEPKTAPPVAPETTAQASAAPAPAPSESEGGPAISGKPQDDSPGTGPRYGFPRRLSPFGPPTGGQRSGPRFGNDSGRPPFGQGDTPTGQSAAPSFDSQLNSFSGPDAVIINITNATFDVTAAVRKLAEQLSVKGYLSRSSGNTGVMALRFAGPLEQVVGHIDFGSVVSVDQDRRVIEVRGE